MKLYATIESNRAKKGQGGDWLNLDIYTTNREMPTHKIIVRGGEGVITINALYYHFGAWRSLKTIDTVYINDDGKAKKQTGDTCSCVGCNKPSCGRYLDGQPLCGTHAAQADGY